MNLLKVSLYLLMIVCFFILILHFSSARSQTQSTGYGIGNGNSVYEFSLKDGTPCVIARASYSGSSPAVSCGWERSHASR